MIDQNKIDDLLGGRLSEEEEEVLKQQLQQSPQGQELLAEKALKQEVEEELEREFWMAELKKLEQEKEHPSSRIKPISKIRRIYAISAVAASLLLLFVAGWYLFTQPESSGLSDNWQDTDINYRSPLAQSSIETSQLPGKWEANIAESRNNTLLLLLNLSPNQTFTLEANLFTKNNRLKGDKLQATGTYQVEGKKLTLTLNQSTIEKAPGVNPFNAAAVEQWLKTKRLFKESTTITLLNESQLGIQYDNGEGLLWSKIID